MDERLLKTLKREFSIKDPDIFRISGPLDLTFLMKMYGVEGFEELKNKPYTPQPVPGMNDEEDIFTQIRRGDILLHHPYMTFERWWILCGRRQRIPACWLSSRHCTG